MTSRSATADPRPRPRRDGLYVTALARGLTLLRCFDHNRPRLTVPELIERTGLPQPTVWRLCHTLLREGFLVECDDGRAVMPGLPALTLGYAALIRHPLPQVALPYLTDLTARYRLGMSLAVRDGLDMLYLQRTHGDFIYFNDPVGARRPFATAPTGWACYSAYDDSERDAVCSALKRASPGTWRSTQPQLERARTQFQEHGYVLSLGVMHEHFNAIAVPIRSAGGRVYGLAASGLAADWPRKRLSELSEELQSLARSLAPVADASPGEAP